MNEFQTKCPYCGESSLYVVYAEAQIYGLHAKLTADGFAISSEDYEQMDTSDEKVKCDNCGTTYSLCDLIIEEYE